MTEAQLNELIAQNISKRVATGNVEPNDIVALAVLRALPVLREISVSVAAIHEVVAFLMSTLARKENQHG